MDADCVPNFTIICFCLSTSMSQQRASVSYGDGSNYSTHSMRNATGRELTTWVGRIM